MAYDGSIKINTQIDTKQARSQVLTLENRMSKLSDKIAKLREKQTALAKAKIPTDEYKEISKQLTKAEDKFTTLLSKQTAMVQNGKRGTKEFEKLDEQLEEVGAEIRECNKEMEILTNEGKAFTLGSESDEFTRLSQDIQYAEQEMNILNQRHKEMGTDSQQIMKKMATAFSSSSGLIGKLGRSMTSALGGISAEMAVATAGVSVAVMAIVKLLEGIITVAKKVATAIGKTLVSAFNTLKNVAVASLKAIGNLMTSAFVGIKNIIATLVTAVSSLASKILSFAGLGNLTSGFSTSLDTALTKIEDVNQQYARMQNLLATIKAQTAGAFAPLAEIAIPYIQQALEWVLKLVNAFSQFIALASGKKTWSKAVVSGTGKSGSGSSKQTTEEKQAKADAKAEARYQKAQKQAEERYQKAVSKAEEHNNKVLAEQAEAYKKAEESANHYLSPLDEINKFTEKQEVADVDLMEVDPDDYKVDPEDYIADTVEDVASGVDDGISYIQEVLDADIEKLFDWLKDMWDKADFTELGEKLAKMLQDALESIPWDRIKEGAQKLGKSLATLLNGIFSNKELGYDLGKTLVEAINTAFEFAYAFLVNFDSRNFASFLTSAVKGAFENIDWELIKNTFMELTTKVAEWLDEFVETFPWDELADFVVNSLNTVIESIANFFDTMTENNTWEETGKALGETIRKIFEGVNWDELGRALSVGFEGAWELFKGFLKGLSSDGSVTGLINNLFDFAEAGIEGISKAIKAISSKMLELLQTMLEKDPTTGEAPATVLGRRFGEMISTIVDQIDPQTWADFKNAIVGVLTDILGGLWESVRENGAFEELASKFVVMLSEVDWFGAVYNLVGLFNDIGLQILLGIIEGFAEAMENKIRELIANFILIFVYVLKEVFGIASPAKEMYQYGTFILEGIIEGFREAFEEWTTLLEEWYENYVATWFTYDKWQELFEQVRQAVSDKIDEIYENITTKIEEIRAVWEEKWTAIKDKIKEVWEEIVKLVKEKIDKFKEELDRIESLKEEWNQRWDEFKEKITGVWEEITGIVQSAVDGIVSAIGSIMSKISEAKSAVSSLSSLGSSLGSSKLFSTAISYASNISLPKFATGGVIPTGVGAHLAVVGDNTHETEVVSPLSTIRQAVTEAMTQMNGNSGTTCVKLYLDGTQIAESVVNAGKLNQMSTGKNMFAF